MPFAFIIVEWRTFVIALGVTFAVIGLLLCLRIATLKPERIAPGKSVSLGFVTLPAAAFFKLLAPATFLVVPPATVTVASYHLFEGIKETNSCMKCHVMHPMGNDMVDEESNTLAARHYRNKWIPDKQCYHCHTDYGMTGTMKAKMDGFRHLSRYTTGMATEPIVFKGTFNNQNCLHCHEGTPKFTAIPSHNTVEGQLHHSDMSCLNCHGTAHPSREQRTPGSAAYDRLMNKGPFSKGGRGWD